ncbi:hypothetical protein SVAN01_11204 [Stagonosporopsis vannaccii]|nr:hypothetical protein SVAN01_11204 [Stagonosporopsis vannaccii]
MIFNLVRGVALLTSVAAAITVPRSDITLDRVSQDRWLSTTDATNISTDWTGRVVIATNNKQLWVSDVEKGRKLLAVMKSTHAEAATIWNTGVTAKSEFDGNPEAEIKGEGWNDNPEKQKKELDKQCDFVTYHSVGRTLEALGMGTQPSHIKNIKYFFNCLVVNAETQDLIRQAHEKLNSVPGQVPGALGQVQSSAWRANKDLRCCLSSVWAFALLYYTL